MEIDRKFLIHTLPKDLETYPRKEIAQGYICTDPVVRIRRLGDSYILTCKSKGLMAREEFELPLSKEAFEHLKPKTDGIFIEKTRYFIPLENSLTAELDIYNGSLSGLFTVEVEFESLEEAESFTPPEWFGKDVSEDNRYKNSSLYIKGLPE